MNRDLVPLPNAAFYPTRQASAGMSFLQKAVYVLSRFAGLVQATSGGGLTGGGDRSPAGPAVTTSTVLGLSTAWACIRLNAGVIGGLPCMVYRGPSTRREEARDHPLFRVLHDAPNSEQTALEFWEYCAAALELRGNFFAEKIMLGERLVALQPFHPDQVQPYRVNGVGVIRYVVTQGTRRRDLAADQVLHIRGFGGDPLGGVSTLTVGRSVFGLAMAQEQNASAVMANGMRPAGVIRFEDAMKGDQRDRAEDIMAEKYASAMNAGRPLVLDRGQKWEAIQMAPDDAQMLQSRAFSVEEVCRLFGTPPVLIGHTEKVSAWGTGLEQIKLGWLQFSLMQRLERIEQSVKRQLLTPADIAAGIEVEFNVEGFLRGDSRGRAAYYNSGLGAGWLTINEVRAKENLPPIPGGDVPRIQSQNVPVGSGDSPPNPRSPGPAPAPEE